ncbi:MAG TPA: hypothetical protein VHP11_02905 [Tepidisphaeraceae bacterium]|nr:hypothetical protein [Tepidisphaeraceae bacterium]
MDLSKLPRLSQTQQPAQPAGQVPPSEPTPPPAAPPAARGAEAWISLLLAIVLILFFPRIWQYFLSPSSFTWTFTDSQGSPLAYTKSAYFLVDAGIAAFAIVLLLDALTLLFSRSVILRISALLVTGLGALFNFVVFALVRNEIGNQIMPLLAGGFGVYTLIYQWQALSHCRAHRQ